MRNGLRYQVLELPTNDDLYTMQQINDDEVLLGVSFKVDTKRLANSLRLSHAICYFSAQARTIKGPLRLAQTRHPAFSMRSLIVGLGRAPEGFCVEVE
jgi:hypothetical protein